MNAPTRQRHPVRVTSRLPDYLVTATLGRSATESAGPALLVVAVAVLGSATTGSYVAASLSASAAIAGPVVGALLDRSRHPRREFAGFLLLLAITLAAIALTIGRVPLVVVLLLAFAAGLAYPAITGAWSAQLSRLVPADRLSHAYGYDAATYSVASVVAPPAAAALVAVAARAPLWMPVALALVALLALARMPLHPRVVDGPPQPLRQSLRDGFDALARRPALRRTAVITTIGFAGTAAVFVAAPVLAQERTGSLEFTGVILGTVAAGGVVSSIGLTRRPVDRPDRMIIAMTAVGGVCVLAIGLAPTVPLLLVAAFALGVSEPPLLAAIFQVRIRESPAHVQGQVFTTAASLRTSAFAVATAVSGWLLHTGVWSVIAFGAALHFVAVAVGLFAGPPLPPRRHWVRRTAA